MYSKLSNQKMSAPTYRLFSKFLIIVLIFVIQISTAVAQSSIHYPNDFPQEVAIDLQGLLQKATGKTWGLSKGTSGAAKGFIIIKNINRNYKTGESAYITSDGTSFVRIEAATVNGLIYGSYKYLRNLRFNFYLPDDLYTEIPPISNIYKKTAVIETPAMRIRDFFGTGGFGSGKTDPDRSVQASWQLWKWRNGFGAEFSLTGHVGETFNLENADILEKNRDWVATPIKMGGQIVANTRLNYFNKQAVNFFTDWAIRKYIDKAYTPPPAYISDMVSVEPADGGNYVTTVPLNNHLKTAAPSDQVYYAANVAAEKLEKLFPNHPNIGVNLYAYSDHADVPSFPLHKRVFVQIVPYQFQNIAYGPAFIKRWSSKAGKFGIYDYFKYPDASWDLPGGFPLEELMKRAIYNAQVGSQGTTYETSYSKFSTAIPLWILIRFMADGDVAWEKNYNNLVNNLYKEAATPVKKIFDQFYKDPQFSQLSLPSISQHLQQADALAKNNKVKERINELRQYITYVSLYYQMQNSLSSDLETNLVPLAKMAWTLYETKVIHSYRIMALVSYAFLNANPAQEELRKKYQQLHLLTFPESDEPDAFWKKAWKYGSEELTRLYKQTGSIKNTSQKTLIETPLEQQLQISKSHFQPRTKVTIQSDHTVRGYLALYVDKPTTITVNWTLHNDQQSPTLTLSGMDVSYTTIHDHRLTGKAGTLKLDISKGKTYLFMNANTNTIYKIEMQLNGAYTFFEGSPRGKMNFINRDGEATYKATAYPSYFFVPGSQETVQYRVLMNALQIFDPEGIPVKTNLVAKEGGFEIREFAIPSKFRNHFYKLHITGNYDYNLLNIPDRYFIFDEK